MSAWVSKVWYDENDLNSRRNPKRKFTKMSPGVAGVTAKDEFAVQFLDPDERQRQEKIKLNGKPGKRLADERAAQLTSQLTLGTFESKGRVTWSEFRKEFISKVVSTKAVSTQRIYCNSFDSFEGLCNPKLMRSINQKMIDDFRVGLCQRTGKRKGKISPNTVNKLLRFLRAALRKAKRWEYVEKDLEFQFVETYETEPVYMLPDHFDAIYNACEVATLPKNRPYSSGQWWRVLILTALMTGMRIKELLTVFREDVDLEAGQIRLAAPNTKAKRADRVPIHPVLVEHLASLKDFNRMMFNWPYSDRYLYTQWYAIQKEAGINLPCDEEHEHSETCHFYGFHSLKRACATLNADLLPATVLNAFMRHKNRATTDKYYINKTKLADGYIDQMFVPKVVSG